MKTTTNTIPGNVLNTQDSLVAHCCNCNNTMGAGVAKALRARFPEVYKDDTDAYKVYSEDLLGKCILVTITTRPAETNIKYVANLYGQASCGCGRQVNYEALYNSFESLADQCQRLNINSISMPYGIASALAGGDWNIVLAMINSVFNNAQITVNLYKL